MCGLVGVAGDLVHPDEALIKRLLIYDFFRGPDSTGFAALRNNGEVFLSKIASHPLDLFDTKSFDKALSGYTSQVFLGHNRLATKGKVNGANAHPYKYDHIIGAHNGTLDAESWKRLNEVLGYETDVDSQAIIACIAKIGIEATVALMTQGRTSNEGAWALTWFDTEEGTMNFLRNKWRPLWYAYSEGFKRVLWASEWPMIRAATDLSSTPYKLFETEEGYRFWETEEDWWYRFDLKDLKTGSTNRPKPRVKVVKGREPPTYVAPVTPPFQQGYHQQGVTTMGTPPSSTTVSGSTDGGTHIHRLVDDSISMVEFTATDKKPLGAYMDLDEFKKYNRYGCSWCKADVEYEDRGLIIFEQTGQILCAQCSGHDHTRIYTNPYEMEHFCSVLKGTDATALLSVA